MEIKTCEQYVLKKLEEAEVALFDCQTENGNLSDQLAFYKGIIKRVKNAIDWEVKDVTWENSTHRTYLSFDAVWDDNEDYEYLVRFFGDTWPDE